MRRRERPAGRALTGSEGCGVDRRVTCRWGAGYLRRAAHASPGYLELCLHTLTMGVAVLSLFTWLADLQ